MSLDIGIKAKREVEIYSVNVTYNLSPMYYKCIDGGLKALDGLTCREALPILHAAIIDLTNNKERYEKLNPENGWGSYDGLVHTLQSLRDCCELNQDGVLEVE